MDLPDLVQVQYNVTHLPFRSDIGFGGGSTSGRRVFGTGHDVAGGFRGGCRRQRLSGRCYCRSDVRVGFALVTERTARDPTWFLPATFIACFQVPPFQFLPELDVLVGGPSSRSALFFSGHAPC